MKRFRKKYKRPFKPFDKERIAKEVKLLKSYGLKNKREIWKAEAVLRKFQRMAKKLIAKPDEEEKKKLFEKIEKLGILEKVESLDDILGLTVEDILKRRLQSVLYLRGLTKTCKQARQLITHGHVRIKERKVTFPSYLVPKDEEQEILIGE